MQYINQQTKKVKPGKDLKLGITISLPSCFDHWLSNYQFPKENKVEQNYLRNIKIQRNVHLKVF